MEVVSVSYCDGNDELEGFIFRPEGFDPPFPAVLMVHEFTGIGAWLYPHAERLARSGYLVLLHDMYGKDNVPDNSEEASRIAGRFKGNRGFMRSRAQAGLEQLLSFSEVDPFRVFTMGFSFGGCSVLELARSGAPVAGTISIYGNLNTPTPEDAENIRGSVLVIHGGRDPVVSNDEMFSFLEEMRAADVDCRIEILGRAGHGFFNSTLTTDSSEGIFYSPHFESQAWDEVESFLSEFSE